MTRFRVTTDIQAFTAYRDHSGVNAVVHATVDGHDVWRERELELRCSVAATANAIVVKLLESDPTFDKHLFAAACGLYVSDGRDTYSDCYPGELTWEVPRPATPATKES